MTMSPDNIILMDAADVIIRKTDWECNDTEQRAELSNPPSGWFLKFGFI
jgi:hypothetical protein